MPVGQARNGGRELHAAMLDVARILQLARSLDGVDVLETPGCVFLYYDPERSIPHDRRQPFATIVTNDEAHGASDRASRLAGRGLYRVNLGVGRETYRAMLGAEPAWGPGGGIVQTGHDFAEVDAWLPHPIYAPMSWVCIVAPSEGTWPRLRALLEEAHALAARANGRLQQRSSE